MEIQEVLNSCHPWRCLTPDWTRCWATWSSWCCVCGKVEPDDLYRSLLTSTILGLWEAEAILTNSAYTKTLFSTVNHHFHSCHAQSLPNFCHLLFSLKNSVFPFSLTKFLHSTSPFCFCPITTATQRKPDHLLTINILLSALWLHIVVIYYTEHGDFFFFSLEVLDFKGCRSEKKAPLHALLNHITQSLKKL